MKTSVNPKQRILVVDDDIDLNTTFALLLEFDGHEVRTAFTSQAALAMLEKSKFDLMIAEYWLPDMKGDELAALVKQKWPDLPLIIATANMEELNQENHPLTGVDCLLDKPFTMTQLREAITWVQEHYAQSGPSEPGISAMPHSPLENPQKKNENLQETDAAFDLHYS